MMDTSGRSYVTARQGVLDKSNEPALDCTRSLILIPVSLFAMSLVVCYLARSLVFRVSVVYACL